MEIEKLENAMETKHREMREEFLALSPIDRLRKMDAFFREIIRFQSKAWGVTEDEVYRRYLRDGKLAEIIERSRTRGSSEGPDDELIAKTQPGE